MKFPVVHFRLSLTPRLRLPLFAAALLFLTSTGSPALQHRATPRIQKQLDAALSKKDAQVRIRLLKAAMSAARTSRDRYGEAEAAFYAAQSAKTLYRWKEAIELLAIAEGQYGAVGAKKDQGIALHELGIVHDLSGAPDKALMFFERALPIEQAARDQTGAASTLLAMGKVLDDLGLKHRALERCLEGQSILHNKDPRREAVALNYIGRIYEELGQRDKALDAYGRALPLFKEVSDSPGQAQTLTNIGVTHSNLSQPQKALVYYKQALPFWKENHSGRAATLNDIGKALKEIGELQKALGYYGQALALMKTTGDRAGEALVLNNMARAEVELGNPGKALNLYHSALRLWRETGQREGEAITLRNAAYALEKLNQTTLAIAFAKESVNAFQALRAKVSKLPGAYQKSYAQEVEPAYRFLAERLIDQGRLSEAEEVMRLLKDSEYYRFLRSARNERIDLTLHEAEWKAKYDALGNSLAKDAAEYEILVDLSKVQLLQPAQMKRRTELSERLAAARSAFSTFLKQASQSFSAAGADRQRLVELRTSTELSQIVRTLPNHPAAIFTLVTDDGVRTILTLRHLTTLKEAKTAKIAYKDLSRKVAQLRVALTSANYDPIPLASELYDILVRPIENDLKDADVHSLLWSLDGPLRYLPMGVLYDRESKQFLIEKYPCSLFTPAKLVCFTEVPAGEPTAMGFGVSRPHTVGPLSFRALDAVAGELAALKRFAGAEVYQDAQFTEPALRAALEKSPNILHLATHFWLKAGDASGSFLLLGDGNTLPITNFAVWMQSAFESVDLFVVSACDTATPVGGDDPADGGELESFSRAAQENGAAAVLGTLWPVNDASTGLLMNKFYELRRSVPKLEALRQAQLWMLRAEVKELGSNVPRSVGTTAQNADLPKFKPDPDRPFSHPYYWAPFVLTGNPK